MKKSKFAQLLVVVVLFMAMTDSVLVADDNAAIRATVPASMPDNTEIYGWVQDLVSFAPRQTGSAGGIKTANYVARQFKEFGLDEVQIEKGDAYQWKADYWALSAGGQDFSVFYMPHSFHPETPREVTFSTGVDGLAAEMVYVGSAKEFADIDVNGKIVVADVELLHFDYGLLSEAGHSVYDPEQSLQLDGGGHPDPFNPNNFPFNYVHAMDRGAVGFVGILSNYFNSDRFYNENVGYFVREGAFLEIPGLWMSHSEGAKLRTLLTSSKTPVQGNMRLEGSLKKVTYHTVFGFLPGNSDETVMVQSHHDSAFSGAVEDASGTAEVLALAKYYGGKKSEQRNRRMMFITMDTHFTDYESHADFVKKYVASPGPQNLNIVANVTIEHIAREMLVEDGQAKMSGRVEPRILIASNSLLDLADKSIRKNDYRRSGTLSRDFFGEGIIPTDVDDFARAGIPFISLIAGPVYLYDMADTTDKVAVDELQPTAVLFADILDAMDKMSVAELKGEPEKK